jgi:hypothetical protein
MVCLIGGPAEFPAVGAIKVLENTKNSFLFPFLNWDERL